jgi:hypothetical protein
VTQVKVVRGGRAVRLTARSFVGVGRGSEPFEGAEDVAAALLEAVVNRLVENVPEPTLATVGNELGRGRQPLEGGFGVGNESSRRRGVGRVTRLEPGGRGGPVDEAGERGSDSFGIGHGERGSPSHLVSGL